MMPWASKTVIEARREFVALAQSPNANIRGLCRRFNICPQVAYKFLTRFRAEGDQGLHDRSHRPLRTPLRTSEAVEDAVLAIRADYPRWGARKIANELRTRGDTKVPAASTIHEILSRHGKLRHIVHTNGLRWLSTLPHKKLRHDDLPQSLAKHPDFAILLERLQKGNPSDRKRALVIFADRYGLRGSLICKVVDISPVTYRRYIRIFEAGGAQALFARRVNPHRKFDNEAIQRTLFGILHQPPSNFDINRTTWTMADLSRVMTANGQPVSEDVIRTIIKAAGFRWRNAAHRDERMLWTR
jgi:transposase